MAAHETISGVLRGLTGDGWLLFLTRFLRLFAYGSLSVVLVFYLVSLGLAKSQTGLLFSLTLAGNVVVSLFLTTRADRIGRRRMLIGGALLMAGAGVAFACTHNFLLLVVAGTVGVISPSGHEVGPFLSIEQAALSHVVPPETRTEVFAWYTLAGLVATAIGALCAGVTMQVVQKAVMSPVNSYRVVVIAYAAFALLLAALFVQPTPAMEVRDAPRGATRNWKTFLGIGQSHGVVLKLSSLLALDSFAGGFVIQSFAAYWFYLRFGVNPETLGAIFFWANVFAGLAALVASRLASPIGLVQTMVVTHLPSNVLLILVPLMPTLFLAVAGSPGEVQHQPDGRSHETVLHDGGRESGGAFRGRGRHWSCPDDGGRHQPAIRGFVVRAIVTNQRAFFPGGRIEDCVRPAALQGIRRVHPPEGSVNAMFRSANRKSKTG